MTEADIEIILQRAKELYQEARPRILKFRQRSPLVANASMDVQLLSFARQLTSDISKLYFIN